MKLSLQIGDLLLHSCLDNLNFILGGLKCCDQYFYFFLRGGRGQDLCGNIYAKSLNRVFELCMLHDGEAHLKVLCINCLFSYVELLVHFLVLMLNFLKYRGVETLQGLMREPS